MSKAKKQYKDATPEDIPENHPFKELTKFFPEVADYYCVACRWLGRHVACSDFNKLWQQTIDEMQTALMKCSRLIFDKDDPINSTPESTVLFCICKLAVLASEINSDNLARTNTIQYGTELGYSMLHKKHPKDFTEEDATVDAIRFNLIFSYVNKKTNQVMLMRLYIYDISSEAFEDSEEDTDTDNKPVFVIRSWEISPVPMPIDEAIERIHDLNMSYGFVILMNPLNYVMDIVEGFPEDHTDLIADFYDNELDSTVKHIELPPYMEERIKNVLKTFDMSVFKKGGK